MNIAADDSWVGKDLIGLNFRQKYGVNVIAIKKENSLITSPHGADIIENGDTLVVSGDKESIEKLEAGY
jgi:trk system potassium uptake protein TrkA